MLDIKELKEFMTKSDSGKAEAKSAGFEWYVNHGSPFVRPTEQDNDSNGDADTSQNGEPDVPRPARSCAPLCWLT
jgi:hypothetical protein